MALFKSSSSDSEAVSKGVSRPTPGLAEHIAGESKQFRANLKPHLPNELIGGTLPHVAGAEEESVWNAASQACGTEKVHYCYTVDEGKVYYIATPSAAMASNPDSWCPLAAALPGNSEYWDKETVYIFEQEGMASALRWDQGTGRMEIYLGASRTILPRIQTMDANFVTIQPEGADIMPWKNRELRTELLSRAMVRMLLITAIIAALVGLGMIGFSIMSVNFMKRNLTQVKLDTDKAAIDLMTKATRIIRNDSIQHMVNIQTLLQDLAEVNGTLVRYEVKNDKLIWQALVPQAFSKEFPSAKVVRLEDDGRVRINGTSVR